MIYNEIQQDLFTVPQGYYLAHCISGDYALGAGIAKRFDELYDTKRKLHKLYPIKAGAKYDNVGRALLIDNVFNLVTKNLYYQKPTYITLTEALGDMKIQMLELGIKKIAMPMIGCGLDRLRWEFVKDIVTKLFSDIDVEILVCRL